MTEIIYYNITFCVGVLAGFKLDFLVGVNDWYPVWSDRGQWFDEDNKVFVNCAYEILYSPSRKMYELNTSGHKPKENTKYKLAVQKLNEYINNAKEKNII